MKLLKVILLLLVATFILSLIGFYNGYPLVYSDTGTYIYCGFNLFIPKDRPVPYGLFIRFFSFRFSLWLVVFFQNFITSFIIYEVMKTIRIQRERFAFVYLVIITILTMFTGIGWYSNQIMPDFFAPLMIMSVFVLLWKKNIMNVPGLFIALLLIFALVSHFSHMMIGTVIMIVLIILRFSWKKYFGIFSLKRFGVVTALVLSSWVVLPGFNYIVEKKFILSKSSHVFLMAHLVDTGILEKFLKDKCDDEEYNNLKLCKYKDQLPTDLSQFIWKDSILIKTGGWEDSKEEYNKIIFGTLKDPEFLLLNIWKSTIYGFVELTQNDIGAGLSPYRKGSAPWGQVSWRFPTELNNYLNSRQNSYNGMNLKVDLINKIQSLFLILSVLFLIYLFTIPSFTYLDPVSVSFLLFIILGIIVNAFVTGGLNSPYSRFEARVVWMLPLAIMLIWVKNQDFFHNRLIKRNIN